MCLSYASDPALESPYMGLFEGENPLSVQAIVSNCHIAKSLPVSAFASDRSSVIYAPSSSSFPFV